MDLVTGMLLLCAIPATVFAVGFAVLDPWWRTSFGWHIMAYSAVMAVILDLAVYNRLVGGLPDWVGPVVYVFLAAVLWQRLILLVAAHWPSRGH